MRQLLRDIAEIGAGQGAPQGDSNYCNNGTPFIKAGNMENLSSGGSLDAIQKVSEEVAKAHNLKLYPKGTVLFAKSGMSCLKGYIYVLPRETYVVSHLACITPHEDISEYLRYYFEYHKPNQLVKDPAYPSISLADIGALEIDIKNAEKRANIISKLNSAKSIIGLRKQEIQRFDELIKARFVEMFGDPETNPKGWQQVILNDVCSSIVRGPFGSALKKEFFVEPNETTYKVYEQKHAIQKSASIGEYYITFEKFKELKRFECVPGDILMSCSGTMGELFQLPEGCERGIINQALCKFTLNQRILPICFLVYMRQTIKNLETKGSGIQNIAAVSYVKAMPINLPPMDVQEQFAAFVAQIDKSKFVVQKALDKAQLLFDSLMQKYFG